MDITKGYGSRVNLAMVRGDYECISVNVHGETYTVAEDDFIELTVRRTELSERMIYKKVSIFPEGRAVIEFLPEDTEGMEFGKYVYDMQLTYANHKPKTIIELSDFIIKGESTYGDNG